MLAAWDPVLWQALVRVWVCVVRISFVWYIFPVCEERRERNRTCAVAGFGYRLFAIGPHNPHIARRGLGKKQAASCFARVCWRGSGGLRARGYLFTFISLRRHVSKMERQATPSNPTPCCLYTSYVASPSRGKWGSHVPMGSTPITVLVPMTKVAAWPPSSGKQ